MPPISALKRGQAPTYSTIIRDEESWKYINPQTEIESMEYTIAGLSDEAQWLQEEQVWPPAACNPSLADGLFSRLKTDEKLERKAGELRKLYAGLATRVERLEQNVAIIYQPQLLAKVPQLRVRLAEVGDKIHLRRWRKAYYSAVGYRDLPEGYLSPPTVASPVKSLRLTDPLLGKVLVETLYEP